MTQACWLRRIAPQVRRASWTSKAWVPVTDFEGLRPKCRASLTSKVRHFAAIKTLWGWLRRFEVCLSFPSKVRCRRGNIVNRHLLSGRDLSYRERLLPRISPREFGRFCREFRREFVENFVEDFPKNFLKFYSDRSPVWDAVRSGRRERSPVDVVEVRSAWAKSGWRGRSPVDVVEVRSETQFCRDRSPVWDAMVSRSKVRSEP